MFKSINEGKIPERATKFSAGFDVFANEDVVIGAGETKVIGLGICINSSKMFIIAEDENIKLLFNVDGFHCEDITSHYLELHPRSSLRAKGLGGGVGIIDMDYRDEIKMVITNPISDNFQRMPMYHDFEIKRGDKIGQLILKRHEGWLLPVEYTKDEERLGGFGSTNASDN